MDQEYRLLNYLNDISSSSPTPGGGNVSAICAAISSSLGTMVANLTIGKKKFAGVESEVILLRTSFEQFRNRFIVLADKDNTVFEKVMAGFKLPKETDEQIGLRNKVIQEATLEAAMVPAEVINEANSLLPDLIRISIIGNQNSLSDAAVAISLLRTAAEGAFLNVAINCSSLTNKDKAEQIMREYQSKYQTIKKSAENALEEIIKKVTQ